MHKNQVYAMLSESYEENQWSYMDPTPLNHLSESDAGDAEFMGSLLTEFLGFEDSILEFLAEPAKSDVGFFDKLLKVGSSDRQNWSYLRYASDAIKANPLLYSGWIKESHSLECLKYADHTVIKNPDILTLVKGLVEKELDMVKFAPEELRDDGQLMKKSVASNPLNLEFASERLKRDAEFVLDAIAADAKACRFVDQTLYQSESFVRSLIERVKTISSQTFKSIPESFKRDREYLIKIARKLESGSELKAYVDPSDREFFSEIFGENGQLINFSSEDIKDDDELAREAVKGGASLISVSERLRNDADFVCWAIEGWPARFRRAGEKAQNDRRVALAAVSKQGSALDWASKRLKNDYEVVSAAVEEQPDALQYASNRIRNDKEFILRVCAIDPSVYVYAGDSLFSDREFAMFIVPKVVNSLRWFSADIQNDPVIQSVYINNKDEKDR